MCPGHLKDRGFCAPVVDEAAVAAKKKQEMDAEVERVKKEFDEKQQKRRTKENEGKVRDEDKDKKQDKKNSKAEEASLEEKVLYSMTQSRIC